MRDEDLIELFSRRLPDLLDRRPELEPQLYRAFLKTFARRDEVALVLAELRAFSAETNRRFDRVERRVDRVESGLQEFRAEVATRFDDVQRAIDRLGARWGIR